MALKRIVYRELKSSFSLYGLLAFFGVFILAAGVAFWYLEHHGHIVTGMNNQIVWGLPHVFAIFLIVAASGALNVASIGSVFGKKVYKPMSRMSGLMAIALLLGGLAVLVLDLGRPDRLIVAMTSFNLKSIFTWNILLYTGFMGIVGLYLFAQMARGISPFWIKTAGLAAFVWRLVLTTGTGSIFGWLVARETYDAAVLAPLFIAMSLSFGMAFFILISLGIARLDGRPFGDALLSRLGRLMGVLAAVVLYFVLVHHLTALYATEHHSSEYFMLVGGGIYTLLFWVMHVLLGNVVPMALVFHPKTGKSRAAISLASLLVLVGGFSQIYALLIGGQVYPLELFPGHDVQSSFFDGAFGQYAPSLPEFVLGLGGIALALAITIFGMKVLKIMPTTLADSAVDPHHKAAEAA